MGKHDTSIGIWLSDEERFADLYNAAFCNGETFFKAKNLKKIDTKQNLALKNHNGNHIHIQRFRDIAMQSSDGTKLFLLTCENQDSIHLAMPVRSMLYDSLEYTAQLKTLSAKNRAQKNYQNSSEFLSGITSKDRLTPILPLVFYYGDDEWTQNLDLHSLLDISDEAYEKFHSYIPNYKINLVNAKELAEKNCLHTDLQQILGMLKYKGDKEKLLEYVQENHAFFENIDADSYNAAKVFLGSELQLRELEKKEVTVNMCKALDDFYQDGVNEGLERGIETGTIKANERYSKLIIKLSEEGKTDWILKIANDSDFREELFQKYSI